MKKYILFIFSFCLIINQIQATSIVGFEGQDFGTTNWTENTINWELGSWANIRSYGGTVHTGSNSAVWGGSGDYILADHFIDITSVWILVDNMFGDNTYITFNGYTSGGALIKSLQVNSTSYNSGYTQINLSGFSSIEKLELIFDGGPSIFIDDISYSDQGVLPVELTTFSAFTTDNLVNLKWETSTEVNNYGFEVERNLNELNVQKSAWQKVGFVEGHGNSNSTKFYSFTDNSISESGKYSYRLKQIDIDGKYKYSDEVEINIGIPNKIELSQNYPNPFNPTTTISYSLPTDGLVTLIVYDELGRQIIVLENGYKKTGVYKTTFKANELSSGIYYYKMQIGDFTQIRKMLLLK